MLIASFWIIQWIYLIYRFIFIQGPFLLLPFSPNFWRALSWIKSNSVSMTSFVSKSNLQDHDGSKTCPGSHNKNVSSWGWNQGPWVLQPCHTSQCRVRSFEGWVRGQVRIEKGTACRDSLLCPRSLILMISFYPENDLAKDYLRIKIRKPEGQSLNNVSEVT